MILYLKLEVVFRSIVSYIHRLALFFSSFHPEHGQNLKKSI